MERMPVSYRVVRPPLVEMTGPRPMSDFERGMFAVARARPGLHAVLPESAQQMLRAAATVGTHLSRERAEAVTLATRRIRTQWPAWFREEGATANLSPSVHGPLR